MKFDGWLAVALALLQAAPAIVQAVKGGKRDRSAGK